MNKPKLIFVVTEDWYFLSHRLPTVRGAQAAGYDVAVITNAGQARAAIEQAGVRVIPFDFARRSLNPVQAFGQILRLRKLYALEKPQVIHHIAMKPILFGSLAACMTPVPHIVNAFAGLGYVFTSDTMKARSIRTVLVLMFRMLLQRPANITLFQNDDDRILLEKLGALRTGKSKTALIRGSGVDIDQYRVDPLPERGDFICVFAGRMIGIKGLPTLKEAFDILKQEAPHIKLWLCGQPDPGNPGSWTQSEIDQWCLENPNVIHKGHCRMDEIWPQTHIALQPSYGGEGIPKSLLEAAACGRAIIATDVPGCREMVRDAVNGALVPAYDAKALAAAILKIEQDRDICRRMGQESRAMVEGDLSAAAVMEKARLLYAGFLKH
ncbi:MAG: glycosyltransferase family 4 protein [Micavibrio sp.]